MHIKPAGKAAIIFAVVAGVAGIIWKTGALNGLQKSPEAATAAAVVGVNPAAVPAPTSPAPQEPVIVQAPQDPAATTQDAALNKLLGAKK